MNGIKEQAHEAIAALYSGDEDRAAELLASMTAGPTIDVQTVVDAAMDELKLEPVKARLRAEFPSVFEDQDLALIADRHYHAHLASGRTKAEAAELAARGAMAKLGLGWSNGASENAAPSETIMEMRKARGQPV